ncbi:DUF779 domain-containing protein [Schinkia azotoformans]|uniref:DUF779 domain-containing protein n=1 Tax=Schinkia azotoformans TaxID=1454 RepID=UPI002DB68B95|nr:DUF779 domain-containing protein [Schinkia azotoformans]MEC1778089.1 DUF779 domain-containing protein [Schinkia azotoformans]MED4328149.1 DUF779 domain-containing protein [Schinkia azotoformans]
MVERVIATDEALKLIESIRKKHGQILLYQSGGCCDGSSPMCYSKNDFFLGGSDIYLGSLGNIPFYMHRSQYEYWKHTQLIIDAIPGRGATFSLDSVEDRHFITQSRVFTAEEYKELRKLL